ncbi:glucosamine-6-phosphate isomerase [Staphylococcus piscifermentans]|uniref:Glucosamine-6-phosphate isomerase n=1 Tax=Staphylococcus piscifermentans TaxID=70258 RepID=A0A239TVX9_9STAP|nr:glucosamine-6-phosphate isomerase [Staphylococcus piscifermentans]RTX85269.1 glucosamine-6-phosphate isomerase [Staphylococcus piscifermentans]GEP85747.1 glucosamine-6-phosphate isomerase [Staphylococcus piscifermentans]SNV02141.1 glucosamine-6-phosphate isomerase [Staphylococcus piscifermentans]
MAMNFKVFPTADTTARYAADIIRKQFNNNPTTIMGVHLADDHAPVLEDLKQNVLRHPVDFSQINIFDYDDNKSYYETLGVPATQIYELSYNDNPVEKIEEDIKSKENKAKFTMQVVSINTKGKLDVSVKTGLMPAREIVLVVTGAEKAELVKKLYGENGNSSYVPSDLKAHRMVNVLLDEAAAEGLPEDVRQYFTERFA